MLRRSQTPGRAGCRARARWWAGAVPELCRRLMVGRSWIMASRSKRVGRRLMAGGRLMAGMRLIYILIALYFSLSSIRSERLFGQNACGLRLLLVFIEARERWLPRLSHGS